jgi:hypothetical protein
MGVDPSVAAVFQSRAARTDKARMDEKSCDEIGKGLKALRLENSGSAAKRIAIEGSTP